MQREEDLMMFEEGETMEEEGMMVEDHQQGGMNMEGEAEEELVEAEEDLYGYRRHQQTQGGQSSAGFGLRHLLTRAAATASSSATVVQSASATVSSVLHWAEDDFVAAVGAYDVGARIQRLVWMGDRLSNCTTSPSAPSASTAYKLACLQLTAHSCNAQLYAIVYAKYKQLQSSLQHLPGSDLLLLDEEWLNATNRTNRAKLDKLESELRNYKSNLIKESIRMGHNDLGDHYYQTGDFSNAIKCYSKMRDFCATPRHILDHCMKIIKVSIELRNFGNVLNFVSKAETTPEMPDKDINTARLRCCVGLAYLEMGKLKQAAQALLSVNLAMLLSFPGGGGSSTSPVPPHVPPPMITSKTAGAASGSGTAAVSSSSSSSQQQPIAPFADVIAANDVAVYAALCALATFDRTELKRDVLDSADARAFLELEPEIRELVHSIYHSRYSVAWEILERKKSDFMMDMYLSSHIETLYAEIRSRAVCQYLAPFSRVDLVRMATAFGVNSSSSSADADSVAVRALENEIALLVGDGLIEGRIDRYNKVFISKKSDARTEAYAAAARLGDEYERMGQLISLRMGLTRANVFVKPESQSQSQPPHHLQQQQQQQHQMMLMESETA